MQVHPKSIEAARLADVIQKAALDLNRLTIDLRGTGACANANEAFLAAASAAARCADLVQALG